MCVCVCTCQQAHECVVEYATPLLTLYRMSQESSAGFGEPERRQQVLLFYRTLQDILEHSLECRNRYKLILLNGRRSTECVSVCAFVREIFVHTLWSQTDSFFGDSNFPTRPASQYLCFC